MTLRPSVISPAPPHWWQPLRALALALATRISAVTPASARGLYNLALNAGDTGASTATVGTVTGNLDAKVTDTGAARTAVAGVASVYGAGIDTTTVNVSRNGTGTVGAITGEVTNLNASSTAIDTVAGLGTGNLAYAQGGGILTLGCERRCNTAATAVGTVGNIFPARLITQP